MSSHLKIAVIPGDGIGTEVIPVGQRAIEAVAQKFDFNVTWDEYDWSCQRYVEHGAMMPSDGVAQIASHDAIYLGAVGWPSVPDHVSLWGLLIPFRREFQQYANIRPVRLLKGVTSPLAGRTADDIDFIVVRENVEGEYSEVGGRLNRGTEQEIVSQLSTFTRVGVDRILRYAFELARSRDRKQLTSATKSNGIVHTMPFWDERFEQMSKEYSDVTTNQFHIDILTAQFVLNPDWFDVVVGSNLFGDILSDLGPAIAGSIGIAPSANINPEREFPSMFEPVHGSAPDIAGKGIANPIAAVWAAAMMLEHLEQPQAALALERAIEETLSQSQFLTRDLGGSADTKACGDAIVNAIQRSQ